jgi:ferritin-like metal-binding protein YciE
VLDDLKARMTNIDDSKALFVHNLGAALTMENTVNDMLAQLIEAAQSSELKQQLRHHKEETEGQIRNLHQVFQSLGMEPKEMPCPAIEGIEKEGQTNLMMVSEDLHDDVILKGAAGTEHHEIATYETLITYADAMGHDDIVALLRENLEQEQHTLGEVLKATLKRAQQQGSKAKA